MRSVTKDEFYRRIGPLDVVGSILPGPYPYTTVFKPRYGGGEVAKTVGKSDGSREYLLA